MTQTQQDIPLWQSKQYSVYADRIVQGDYVARAISPTEMVSSYQSPANAFKSPRISLKFSINGKNNEMESGKDHHFHCLPQEGRCETPPIRFGQQFVDDTPIPHNTYLEPNTRLKIRLDMRQVLADFESKGFYENFHGDKIYREDFKGVYVAGSTAPLRWDFDNLVKHPELELKDPDGEGIYETTLLINEYQEEETSRHWKLSHDLSAFPQYRSDYPLLEALYHLALEEMQLDIEADGTFRTGEEWAGVWTRDISYSMLLSMAELQPEVSRKSLMQKVKNGKIVQDTGTGGAYPVSTDRVVWGIAAWELYQVTGDREWLQEAYQITRNSIEDDLKNAYDEKTGLFRGESSFLDWREQTYPEWMQPVDIYESESLGTNAVFYQASVILSKMATLLEDQPSAEKYRQLAAKIKKGMQEHLWLPDQGYYGQFLYGRNFKIRSPRAEALGEALCVLFDVADADQQKTIVAQTPVTAFGIPNIYPQISNVPPYHNNGIWPFVQAFWTLATAKAGNETALMESMCAMHRASAFFLTNKENFVASNGDYVGTQINSDRQLWSVAGSLGMVFRVLFGMHFHPDQLVLQPFVPKALEGRHVLTGFTYRKAVLDIVLSGSGNKIQSFVLDGKTQEQAVIPGDLSGRHSIQITLANQRTEDKGIRKLPVHFSPPTPSLTYADHQLRWKVQDGIREYQVLKNGELHTTTRETTMNIDENGYAEYQLISVDTDGHASFASEPVVVGEEKAVQIYQMEEVAGQADYSYKGFSGKGFVEISKTKHMNISIPVQVSEAGLYAIDFRYANGNGPINTDNKAAIRSLKKEDVFLGTIVMPQRGQDEWSGWGFTNTVLVELEKGVHTFTLSFEAANENMNGEVNQAMLDYMRLTRLK